MCDSGDRLKNISLAILSANGFMSKKNNPLKCMPCLPFSFSDEQFGQNGEKVPGRGKKLG